MELDEFINKTIIDICNGIMKAKKNPINKNGAIAPPEVITPNGSSQDVHKVREVEFDLSVRLSENNKLEIAGKAGINLIAKADASIDTNNSFLHEESQKIKFSVPLIVEAL